MSSFELELPGELGIILFILISFLNFQLKFQSFSFTYCLKMIALKSVIIAGEELVIEILSRGRQLQDCLLFPLQ